MIDHVSLYVYDLAKSLDFYQKTLASLGFGLSFGEEGGFWAFDVGEGTLFEILQYKENNGLTPSHIAFRANSHEQVNKFYNSALHAGATCNGKPGPRPQYTEGYYAAFVFDLNGHNIEAVFDSAWMNK